MTNSVSATRTISALPSSIFNIIANPRRHKEIDGSGHIQGFVDSPDRLFLGAKFSMDVKMGAKYKTVNTVIEFEDNKKIAWKHIGQHVWRYELVDNHDGTTDVTETWDWSPCPFWERWGLELSGFPKKNLESMQSTLERLAVAVENTQ